MIGERYMDGMLGDRRRIPLSAPTNDLGKPQKLGADLEVCPVRRVRVYLEADYLIGNDERESLL
jgi:hypothetical protein